jgi:hypothetical protein
LANEYRWGGTHYLRERGKTKGTEKRGHEEGIIRHISTKQGKKDPKSPSTNGDK